MEDIVEKSAREISVDSKTSGNDNVSIKIGTVENRNSPSTIFINFSFWLNPKESISTEEENNLRRSIEVELDKIYKNEARTILEGNTYFPYDYENIFIKTIPENINYNSKKNYISFELYLHTLNIDPENSYPLNKKKNTELYDEAIKVCNIFSKSDFLQGKGSFNISKTSK
jgi:hypothetical protein